MAAAQHAPEFLTVREAAKVWRINRNTLIARLKKGEVAGARQIGRQWRIPREAVYGADPVSSQHAKSDRGAA